MPHRLSYLCFPCCFEGPLHKGSMKRNKVAGLGLDMNNNKEEKWFLQQNARRYSNSIRPLKVQGH